MFPPLNALRRPAVTDSVKSTDIGRFYAGTRRKTPGPDEPPTTRLRLMRIAVRRRRIPVARRAKRLLVGDVLGDVCGDVLDVLVAQHALEGRHAPAAVRYLFDDGRRVTGRWDRGEVGAAVAAGA